MKKLILLLLSLTIITLSASNTYAQEYNNQKPTAEEIAKQNPAPKQTSVKYAPNAKQPTLAEEIATIEKMLVQLKATPASDQPLFIKEKIARLEKELVVKKAQRKSEESN
jgi:hypothetical protein